VTAFQTFMVSRNSTLMLACGFRNTLFSCLTLHGLVGRKFLLLYSLNSPIQAGELSSAFILIFGSLPKQLESWTYSRTDVWTRQESKNGYGNNAKMIKWG
jgi:hypothetical protein